MSLLANRPLHLACGVALLLVSSLLLRSNLRWAPQLSRTPGALGSASNDHLKLDAEGEAPDDGSLSSSSCWCFIGVNTDSCSSPTSCISLFPLLTQASLFLWMIQEKYHLKKQMIVKNQTWRTLDGAVEGWLLYSWNPSKPAQRLNSWAVLPLNNAAAWEQTVFPWVDCRVKWAHRSS